MASGTFTFTTNNKYITGRIRWSSASNGSTANSSYVTAYLDYKKSSASTGTTYGTFGGYININGSSKNLSLRLTLSPNDTWINAGSHAVTIAHAADGTQSIYIEANGGISGTSFSANTYRKTGLALDNIPRYATVTSFKASNITQTSATFTITTNAVCSKYEYKMNNGAYQAVPGSTFTISGLTPGASYSFRCRVTRKDSGLTTESQTITVKTIPIATLSGSFDLDIGSDLTVSLENCENNASTLEVCVQSQTGAWSDPLLTAESPAGESSCTIPLSEITDTLYQSCPSSNAATIRIACGATLNGRLYQNFYTGKTSVTDSDPIFTDFTCGNTEEQINAALENASCMVENFGNMQVNITPENQAVPQNCASIDKYIITVTSEDSLLQSVREVPFSAEQTISADLGSFSQSGVYTVCIHAVDSRGNTSPAVTKNFHVLPYRLPAASVSLKRYNEFEKETLIDLSASYSKLLLDGTLKNTPFTIQYRFAETGMPLPAAYTPITDFTSDFMSLPEQVKVTYSNTSTEEPFQILDSSKSYHFEFLFTDCIGSVRREIDVIEGIPIMMETDTGKIAIGMIPEMDSPANLQIATDILATDTAGKQRLVLGEIDQVREKVNEVTESVAGIQEAVTELNKKLSVNTSEANGLTYERYGNGRMKVYGRVTSTSPASVAIVNLAIPFKNTGYTIQATPEYYSSTYATFQISVQKSTASSFNVYTRNNDGSILGGVNVYVMLDGWWK